MTTYLKIVSDNPNLVSAVRLDGQALHQLANRLTEAIQAGHSKDAKVMVAIQKLSPFAIAVVATWMAKAGLSEADILNAVI